MAEAESTRLYEGVPTTSEATLFTCKARTVIRSVRASGDATGGTVTLSVVPKGGTAGAANRIAQAFPVAAAASVDVIGTDGQVTMNPGDFISGLQSSGTHITLLITGDAYGDA